MKELHLELFLKLPKLEKFKKELTILIDVFVNCLEYEPCGSDALWAEMCTGVGFLGCNLGNFI